MKTTPAGIVLTAIVAALHATDAGAHAVPLTDGDMREVSARGLADNLLSHRSLYFSDGNAVEVLGDIGFLLNPPLGLPGAHPFASLIFNPASMSALVDRDGSVLLKLSTRIDQVTYPDIRLDGGRSFGSITLRDIDLRGTTLRISHAH